VAKFDRGAKNAMIAFKLQCAPRGPLFSEEQWLVIADRLELSPRELQIVKLVFVDAQERSIAGELGVSAHTIHTQLKRLYRKLGVTSRVELVLRIVGAHLADAHTWPTREADRSEPTVRLHPGARKAA
jgi:DNA-binding CsgD family transcriptional regulator